MLRHGRNLLLLTISIFAVACAAHAPGAADRAPSSTGPMKYAIDRLREKGLSEKFLTLLQDKYREDQRQRVLDLNLLGFLKLRPEQDERIPGWELKKVQKFLSSNRKAFNEVEKQFPVPREVIASLLWVETKHGKDIGKFHVASAFLSIVQADYPPILDQTIDLAKSRTKDFTKAIEDKIISRSKTKSEWAANELVALQEIHDKGFKDAATLEGSFSGAFGMAQFLPSSYLTWARGRKAQPNLFKADDSIYSVANYLSVNGWQKTDKVSQEAALFHYNRDKDYGRRILRMSECLRKGKTGKSKRHVASLKTC